MVAFCEVPTVYEKMIILPSCRVATALVQPSLLGEVLTFKPKSDQVSTRFAVCEVNLATRIEKFGVRCTDSTETA